MKNLNCNQIETFINLEIIGEEDKNKKHIFIFLIHFFFLQFDVNTWRNHGF